jgi:hypothetical protein
MDEPVFVPELESIADRCDVYRIHFRDRMLVILALEVRHAEDVATVILEMHSVGRHRTPIAWSLMPQPMREAAAPGHQR